MDARPVRAETNPSAAEPAFRCHCAGLVELMANTNLTTLRQAAGLPSWAPVKNLALSRFARGLAASWGLKTNSAVTQLLEPLVVDALDNESFASVEGEGSNPHGFHLAIRLGEKKVQSWLDGLTRVFGGGGEKFSAQDLAGRQWKIGPDETLWILSQGDWVVAGRDKEPSVAAEIFISRLNLKAIPKLAPMGHWLEADLDLARLSAWLPEAALLLKPAHVKLTVNPVNNNLQVAARATYLTALPQKLASWQMPKGLVTGPLASFTACQDAESFLNVAPELMRLPGNPWTNQFYGWALDQMPFQSYAAWPVEHGAKLLQTLSTEAPAALNPLLKKFNDTELLWQSAQKMLILMNLRIITPAVENAPDGGRDFLVLSFFPHPPAARPAPQELWEQLGRRKSLIYYDWEQTGVRLREVGLLGSVVMSRSILTRADLQTDDVFDARSLAGQWMAEAGALPGTTITEIMRTAPNELSLERTGPLGLTGFEAYLLGDELSTLGVTPIYTLPAKSR